MLEIQGLESNANSVMKSFLIRRVNIVIDIDVQCASETMKQMTGFNKYLRAAIRFTLIALITGLPPTPPARSAAYPCFPMLNLQLNRLIYGLEIHKGLLLRRMTVNHLFNRVLSRVNKSPSWGPEMQCTTAVKKMREDLSVLIVRENNRSARDKPLMHSIMVSFGVICCLYILLAQILMNDRIKVVKIRWSFLAFPSLKSSC